MKNYYIARSLFIICILISGFNNSINLYADHVFDLSIISDHVINEPNSNITFIRNPQVSYSNKKYFLAFNSNSTNTFDLENSNAIIVSGNKIFNSQFPDPPHRPMITAISDKLLKYINTPTNVQFLISDPNTGPLTVEINSSTTSLAANTSNSYTMFLSGNELKQSSDLMYYTPVLNSSELLPLTLTFTQFENDFCSTTISILVKDSTGLTSAESFNCIIRTAPDPNIGFPILDIDGDGYILSFTDGILIILYLLESRGESLIYHNYNPSGCTRCDADSIENYLKSVVQYFDIDGDGEVRGNTDGLLINRYISEIFDDNLINRVVGNNCTRCSLDSIKSYLNLLGQPGPDMPIIESSQNQIIKLIADESNISDSDYITISVQYDVSDVNKNLFPVCYRIHYDDSKLEFEKLIQVGLQGSHQESINIIDESINSDGDNNTNKVIEMRYSKFQIEELPLKLNNIIFKIKNHSYTCINVTQIARDFDYGFSGQGIRITGPNSPPIFEKNNNCNENNCNLTTEEDTQLNFRLYANDKEQHLIEWKKEIFPKHGILSLSNSEGISNNIYYNPEKDWNGIDSFVLKIQDQLGDSNSIEISVTVIEVNDKPEFSVNKNEIKIWEDNTNFPTIEIQDLCLGPYNEAHQKAEFIIKDYSPDLYKKLPRISDNKLLFTPAPDKNGSDRLKIILSDGIDESDPMEIAIIIDPINDCPNFTAENDSITNENANPVSMQWAANITPGPYENSQKVYFNLSGFDKSLFDIIPSISNDGILTYKNKYQITGATTVSVQLKDDGGTYLNGCNSSLTSTFNIVINPVFYTLNVQANGNGEINLYNNNEEMNENAYFLTPMEKKFRTGNSIYLYANADKDSLFSHWKVDEQISKSNPILLTMDKDKTITAYFEPIPYTLSINGNGTVKIIDISENSLTLPLTQTFDIHSIIKLTAVPESNFIRWTGDINETQNSIEIKMDSNINIEAQFNEQDDWILPFCAENQDISNSESRCITIGVAGYNYSQNQYSLPDQYPCNIVIYKQDDNPKNFFLKTDIRLKGEKTYKWFFQLDPIGNMGNFLEDNTIIIRWDPNLFSSSGDYKLLNGLDDKIIVSKMREVTNYEIAAKSPVLFSILWSIESFDLNLKKGWNLISIPVIIEKQEFKNIFRKADKLYFFDTKQYTNETYIENGKGYWINMPEDSQISISGPPLSKLNLDNELDLTPGWHLISSLFAPCTLTSYSENCIEAIFKYEDTYKLSTILNTGYGYWVKIKNKCKVKYEFLIE